MPFTVPNRPDASYTDQAEPDSVDFQILGDQRFGVLSGGNATQQGTPDMTVAVSSCVVVRNGTTVTVTGGNVTIGAASANHRFDLIVVNSSGALAVVAGTGSTNPRFPTWDRTCTILWAVYVPSGTTSILNTNLVDKRRLIGQEIPAGTISPTIASAADPGYLLLNGTAHTGADALYPSLWSKAPAGWKSGTTLTVPDWREKTLGGFKSGSTTHGSLGGSAGANTKTISAANLPPHAHGKPGEYLIDNGSGLPVGKNFGGFANVLAPSGGWTSYSGVGLIFVTGGSTTDNGPGSSSPMDVINAAGVVNYQIKAH